MLLLDFTLSLPDPNLPGAKQKTPFNINRYVLLIITIVWLFATSCVFLGWPSLTSMLYKSGAYEWVCAKDDKGNYVNDQRLLSNKQYICDEQDTKVQPLLTIAAFCSFFMAAFGGCLVDIAGPKLTGTLGQIFLCISWLSLAFSSELFECYYVAFCFMGLGAGCVVIPAIGISRLFPDMIAAVITLTGAAQSASYAVPVILNIIYDYTNISFRHLCLYYLCICPVSGIIIAFFLFPSKQYVGTDLLEMSADLTFSEEDNEERNSKACNDDKKKGVLSLNECCMVDPKRYKMMMFDDIKSTYIKNTINLAECCTPAVANNFVQQHVAGDLSSQSDAMKSSDEMCGALDLVELEIKIKKENCVVEEKKMESSERRIANVENQYQAVKGQQESLEFLEESKKKNLESPGDLELLVLDDVKSIDVYSKEPHNSEVRSSSYEKFFFSVFSSSSIFPSTSSSFSNFFPSFPQEKTLHKSGKNSFCYLLCKSLLLRAGRRISYAFLVSFFTNFFESKQKKEKNREMISKIEGSCEKKGKESVLPFFFSYCCLSSSSSSFTKETKEKVNDMMCCCVVSSMSSKEKDVLCNSIRTKKQGFSETCKIAHSVYFLAIFVYFVVYTTTSTYYMLSSDRIFNSSVIQSLSVSLPFTFIPCIILGLFIDIFGIMPVIVFANLSATCSFLFTLFTTPLHISHYLSVIFYCIACSVQCSQVFCFLEQTFPSNHFGKLSGIILFMGGSVSFLCIPIYNTLIVHILSGKPFIVTLCVTCVHTAMFAILIYLWFLKKKNPRPFDHIIRKF